MNRRILFPIAGVALVTMLYSNCSEMKGFKGPDTSASTGGGGGGGGGEVLNSLNSFRVYSDGTVKVWQDKELRYSPFNGEAGTYTIIGLPAWAAFDTTTGTITGIPRKLGDTASFTITKTGGLTYGPFNVQIVGDALEENQWHLRNIGQTAFALTPGVAGQDIRYTDSVKNNVLGIGVRIAVSDTGVYLAHPDLTANALNGESRDYTAVSHYKTAKNWLGDPSPAASEPENAHGTAVTGLIAAKGWNGIGGRGVAPEARFAGFKFLQAQDILSQEGLSDVALYDQFAGNFDIFNYSWGDAQCVLSEYDQSYIEKLAASMALQRGGRGAVYMVAAGNSFVEDLANCYSNVNPGTGFVLGNANFSEITTTPYTINVAAVNAAGVTASYSSPGSNVWISATGGEYGWTKTLNGAPEVNEPALITTDYPGCSNGLSSLDKDNSSFDAGTNNTGCEYINTMNGTSGATPIASGVVAMLLQANPALSWRDIKYILAKTADKVTPNINPSTHPVQGENLNGHAYELGWITNSAGFNFQNFYGFGRVNTDKAVQLAKAYTFPLGSFKSTGFKYDSGAVTVNVPNASATGATRTMAVTDNLTIEAVQLRVSTSDCAGDTGLELTSPSGTKSILMNINNGLRDDAILNHIFLTNAFYGEKSAGTWTFKIVDGKAACNTTLTNWKLNFFGY